MKLWYEVNRHTWWMREVQKPQSNLMSDNFKIKGKYFHRVLQNKLISKTVKWLINENKAKQKIDAGVNLKKMCENV